MGTNDSGSMMPLTFALMTVVCWGLYGVCLHTGQVSMLDSANGRYKSFLLVGVAYFLVAVLAPLLMLIFRGADWNFSRAGVTWSLIAGIVGAIGAFCVLLAFGANGKPAVVMSIIFAGAPVVNAVVALIMHPPHGGIRAIPLPFYLGILMAASGGFLVMRFKPAPGKPHNPAAPPPAVQASAHPEAHDAR